MTDPRRVARQTPVSQIQGTLAIEPLLVDAGKDLVAVLRAAASQPATRVIGVVDDTGKLVGILPIVRLIESVVAQVSPEALLLDIADVDDVARFTHALEARVCRDAMLPVAAVAMDATLDDAFREMHRRHVSGLYVLDADGRPIGYLDMLELAGRYVEALGMESTAELGPSHKPD